MPSQMEKLFYTFTSAFRGPLSSTVTVQDNTGDLSHRERMVIILMILMICLLICIAVFKDRRKQAVQEARYVEMSCRSTAYLRR